MVDKRAIKVETLDRLAEGFQESRGITDKLTTEQMIAFAKEPVGGGENKLTQLLKRELTEVTAADLEGVTRIHQHLFYYQTKLKTFEFTPALTNISDYAFAQTHKFESPIVLPNVVYIGQYAFNRCDYAPYAILPKVETIQYDAFTASDNITYIRIGNKIKNIRPSSFSSMSKLTDIYIDKEEGSVSGAPWGATNATIHWNTPIPEEYMTDVVQ